LPLVGLVVGREYIWFYVKVSLRDFFSGDFYGFV